VQRFFQKVPKKPAFCPQNAIFWNLQILNKFLPTILGLYNFFSKIFAS